jgi:hypothetical protein
MQQLQQQAGQRSFVVQLKLVQPLLLVQVLGGLM